MFFNKIWQWISAALAAVIGFLFLKSKLQETKIKKTETELKIKEKELEAEKSKQEAEKQLHEAEIENKEFEAKVVEESTNVIRKEETTKDENVKQVYENENDKTYRIQL